MKANVPTKATVTETYTLPSKGKLYGMEETGGEVTIRSMTTFEEKMRLGNQGFWKVMCNILNAVVTEPENFDAKQLTSFDFHFMMYKMRTVSYGAIYKVKIKCPHCGQEMISKVNLDELKVTYLPDDFTEPFQIGPLPRSGDTLSCRFPRIQDSINNERRSKEILRDNPNYIGDPEYILNIASQIYSVNGEEMLPIEKQLYVEKMDAMDSAYFHQAYQKYVKGLGLELECHDICESCGETIDFSLPFDSEFFRPTFDI